MRPSAFFRALLARLLGPGGDHHLGDLDEDWVARFPRPSLRGELWYAREALALAVAVLRDPSVPSPIRPRRSTVFHALRPDLRSSFQSLRRAPAVTAVVSITLGVTVAAVLAMFAVADVAFFRPLPYPQEEELFRLHSAFDFGESMVDAVSPLDLRGITRAESVVEGTGGWTMGDEVLRTDGPQPVRVNAPRASPSLMGVLGLTPVHGRWFVESESEPGNDRVAVLSHGYWQEAFGADPGAVGGTLELDGEPYRIVGVAPAFGMLPRGADLWRALALGPEWYEEDRWGWQMLGAVARLADGTPREVAEAELNRRFLEETTRASEDGQTRVLVPLRGHLVGESRAGLTVLAFGVALLLAMACLNIVGVLLARSETRRREFGLRRALGAGAGRLGRLVLVETSVLAVAGTVLGVGLAALLLGGVARIGVDALAALQALGPLGLDARVLGAALLLLAAVTGVVGVAPMIAAVRVRARDPLVRGSRGATGGRGVTRLRGGLVIAQIGVSMVLLLAVGISATAYRTIVHRDLGFRPEDVLAVEVQLPSGVRGVEAQELYRSAQEGLRGIPGVQAASGIFVLPLGGVVWSGSFEVETPDRPELEPGGMMRPVLPGYFATMGIPVLEGRVPDETDVAGTTPVVVVDRTVARRYFPDSSPVGRTVSVGGLSAQPAMVIGVVGDVPHERPDVSDGGHVYFPMLQSPQRSASFVLRHNGDAEGVGAEARAVLGRLPIPLTVTSVSLMEARVSDSMAGPRFGLVLLALLGGAAVLLATVGVYGVLAFTVARRTREIGTRMALGAAPGEVVGSVVRQAMGYWVAGVLAGGALSLVAARWLVHLVVEFEGAGVAAWVAAPLLLGAVALGAAVLPASRAVSVDPNEALRAE